MAEILPKRQSNHSTLIALSFGHFWHKTDHSFSHRFGDEIRKQVKNVCKDYTCADCQPLTPLSTECVTRLSDQKVITGRMSGSESFGWTINLVNSVIGVSLLSMPFCFKKCGIVLSVALIVMSSLLNRFSCHLLLKSSVVAKRRNYELLAFHAFGWTGKLMVELSVLGFLLGTCIAFFVVIGDIGPSLVSQLLDVPNGPQLRAFVMTFLGMFVALPLALLRRVDSLTSFSMLSLGLYIIVVLKMLSEALTNTSGKSATNIWQQINYWDSEHLFSSLPIFSMALSCQTQLFAIFDSSLLHNNDHFSLRRMEATVNRSLDICSAIYISVGICGYIAFSDQPFGGNILLYLPSGFISTFTLIAFVFTVLISFPLCLFPCRTSLHSLMSRKGTAPLITTSSPSIHMSDQHFRLLTVALIVTTIGVSILVPYIEVVLAILGSTIGAVICFIFPALIFLRLTTQQTTERLLAQFVVISGVFILIVCTFSTFNDIYFTKNVNLIEDMDSLKPLNRINNPMITELPIERPKEKDLKPEVKVPRPEAPVEAKVPLPPIDTNKAKRQEELLQRLERQQLEHKKLLDQQKDLLNEMNKHNQLFHSLESKKLVINEDLASNHTNDKHFHHQLNPIGSDQQILNSNDKLRISDKNVSKGSVVEKKPPDLLSDNRMKNSSLKVRNEKKVELNSVVKNDNKRPKVDYKLNAKPNHKLLNETKIFENKETDQSFRRNVLSKH